MAVSEDVELQDYPRTGNRGCNGYTTEKDNEYWCWRCGARISVNPHDESEEFGHGQKCPRRPDGFTNRVGWNGVVWSRERIKEALQE